jgi:hypothetical protein
LFHKTIGRHEELPRALQPGQPVLPFHQLGQDLVSCLGTD